MGGITHHANGRRQPFSDSTTRGFRGETAALVDTGVVGTRPVPLGFQYAVTAGGIPRGQGRVLPAGGLRRRRELGCTAGDISVRPGACPSGRGQSTPSGTGILSPHAQLVPVGRKVSPAARNDPTGGHHPLTPSSPTELATP